MSLFRQSAKWSLRALLVWGGIELAGGLYENGAAHWARLAQLAGHREAMTRLEERARASETEAARIEADLARLSGGALPVTPADSETAAAAAARIIREELIQLGAEAPIVDSVETSAASSISRVSITARWREPIETSPQVLHGLAQRFPEMAVERLSLQRGDRVAADAVFSLNVRTAPRDETRVAQRDGVLR